MKPVFTQDREYLWPLVGLSFAIHLGIFGVIYGDLGASSIATPEKFISAKLVRLGKERDEKLLPRKTQEDPEGKSLVAPNIEPEPPPPTRPAPKEPSPATKAIEKKSTPHRKQAVTKATESASSRLDKFVRSMNIGGHKQGSILGTELSGPLEQGYFDEVAQIVRNSFELPSVLSDAERRALEVVVRLRIDAQGHLISIKVIEASTRRLFDDSVVNGAKSVINFGSPPLPLRAKFAQEGLLIKFCPVSCKKVK